MAMSYSEKQGYINKLFMYEESHHIPDHIKRFLKKLIDNNLGVFADPFEHQVFALEQYLSGKNLFVSTGTGSGKTEVYELLKRKLYKYKFATLEMEYLLPAKYHQLSEADELITDVQDGIKTSYESLKSKLDEIYETI